MKKFTKVYQDINKEEVWRVWTDVNHWPLWDKELEYCDLKENFNEGTYFILKPKHGFKVSVDLFEVIPHERFTDYCKYLGARIYNTYELKEEPEGLRITHIIKVNGSLTFLWVKLVAEKAVRHVPEQTDNLVKYIRSRRA